MLRPLSGPPSTRSSPPAGQAPGRSSLGDPSAGGGSPFRVGSRRPSPGDPLPGLPHLNLRGRASSWPPAWSRSPPRPGRCVLVPAAASSPPARALLRVSAKAKCAPTSPFSPLTRLCIPLLNIPSAPQVPGVALPREQAGSGTSKRHIETQRETERDTQREREREREIGRASCRERVSSPV